MLALASSASANVTSKARNQVICVVAVLARSWASSVISQSNADGSISKTLQMCRYAPAASTGGSIVMSVVSRRL